MCEHSLWCEKSVHALLFYGMYHMYVHDEMLEGRRCTGSFNAGLFEPLTPAQCKSLYSAL